LRWSSFVRNKRNKGDQREKGLWSPLKKKGEAKTGRDQSVLDREGEEGGNGGNEKKV